MALDYGFVKGKIASGPKLQGSKKGGETQYHLLVNLDAASTTWQAAINVGTDTEADLLKYRLVANYQHPVLATLSGLPEGLQDLTGQAALPALDYLRGDILANTGTWLNTQPIRGSEQEPPIPDLEQLLETAQQQQAYAYIFGRTYTTGLGVHDIHMNQGSTGHYLNNGQNHGTDINDIWQDGAILVDLGAQGWSAYFCAFTMQLAPTDDLGNPTADAHPIDDDDPGSLAGQ